MHYHFMACGVNGCWVCPLAERHFSLTTSREERGKRSPTLATCVSRCKTHQGGRTRQLGSNIHKACIDAVLLVPPFGVCACDLYGLDRGDDWIRCAMYM